MIVAFTGIRDLAVASWPDVELAVLEAVGDGATELRFGGARGADTVALAVACSAHVLRCVIVPFQIKSQPRDAVRVIEQCADEVHELNLPPSKGAYIKRNRELVRGADLVVAFTDGRTGGGTAATIELAHRSGVPVRIVDVVSQQGYNANPQLYSSTFAAPVFAWQPYVRRGGSPGKGAVTSETVRRLKGGNAMAQSIHVVVRGLARYIRSVRILATADAIACVPRREPGRKPSLDIVATLLAAELEMEWLVGWMVRRAVPRSTVRARRLRSSREEHACTMALTYPYDGKVILLDDVVTFGGTMAGAIDVVLRDSNTDCVGLAVLYSKEGGLKITPDRKAPRKGK